MKKIIFSTLALCATTFSIAQVKTGGLADGIDAATAELKGVVTNITTFLYVLAGIVALYGSIRVYSKHQNGDQDTNKAMGQWGFAFVFLIAAGFIIKATFSI